MGLLWRLPQSSPETLSLRVHHARVDPAPKLAPAKANRGRAHGRLSQSCRGCPCGLIATVDRYYGTTVGAISVLRLDSGPIGRRWHGKIKVVGHDVVDAGEQGDLSDAGIGPEVVTAVGDVAGVEGGDHHDPCVG